MRQAMSPQWPWGQWAELGRGRGEGLARPQGFKAEQGEGLHSPGLGQPLAQLGRVAPWPRAGLRTGGGGSCWRGH